MRTKLLMLSTLALASLSLGACNTVEGIGQDLEEAGRSISDAAD